MVQPAEEEEDKDDVRLEQRPDFWSPLMSPQSRRPADLTAVVASVYPSHFSSSSSSISILSSSAASRQHLDLQFLCHETNLPHRLFHFTSFRSIHRRSFCPIHRQTCCSFIPSRFQSPSFQGATIKRNEITGEIFIARIIHGGLADRSGETVPLFRRLYRQTGGEI